MTKSICLQNNFVETEWYSDANMVQLFIYLLLSAEDSPKKAGQTSIERGQLLTSRQRLKAKLAMSEQRIRRCLNQLSAEKIIQINSLHSGTLVTICVYDEYLSSEEIHPQSITKSELGTGEWIENEKRYYGSKQYKIEVPPDMPPRPGLQYSLDKANKKWLIL